MNKRWITRIAPGVLCLGLCALLRAAPTIDRERRDGVFSQPANVGVQILTEGRPAPVYRDGPYRWIEGRRGQRFAFALTNQNPFPVGVILSADGHSLTADGRARADHPAYVIEPYRSETISVWREDLRGGRELVFTDVDRSLAARKGDRRNIGVLGALVWQLAYREPPRPLPLDRQRQERPVREERRGDAAKAAPGGSAGRQERSEGGIGVGAGERISDPAYLTDRYRRVRVLGTIALYYDDRDGLKRAGVNLDRRPEPPPDRRRSDPFPDEEYRGVRIPD